MFPKIYINKFIFSDKVQFGFSEATASSSHLQILPLLCVIGESPSLKMYGHKLWQSPAIGSSWRAKFGSLDQTGSKTEALNQLDLEMNCLCFSNAFSYSSEEYSQCLSFLLLLLWPNRKIEIINKPVSIFKIFGLKILQRQNRE